MNNRALNRGYCCVRDTCPHGMPFRFPELCDECLNEEETTE